MSELRPIGEIFNEILLKLANGEGIDNGVD
jgi:hypothetical protein